MGNLTLLPMVLAEARADQGHDLVEGHGGDIDIADAPERTAPVPNRISERSKSPNNRLPILRPLGMSPAEAAEVLNIIDAECEKESDSLDIQIEQLAERLRP